MLEKSLVENIVYNWCVFCRECWGFVRFGDVKDLRG